MQEQSSKGYMQQAEYYVRWAYEELLEFLPKLVSAIIILVVGWFVIGFLIRMLEKFFAKRDYDISLQKFIINLLSWSLKALLIITVIGQLGVKTSSLIAVLGAAGLAIGLALQGALSNFAGGVLILIFRPFKVGDFIEAQGHDGTVDEITILHTQLLTLGNQRIVIPNGNLFNNSIKNYSSEPTRKEYLSFGISYDDDVVKGKEILLELAKEQEKILEEPAPEIYMTALGDSSVNLSLRYWAKREDFWPARWYTLEEGKKRLEAAGITIPFPQRDVHFYQAQSPEPRSPEKTQSNNKKSEQ